MWRKFEKFIPHTFYELYNLQISVNGHISCLGDIGLQIFWPNCTIKSLIGIQYSWGIISHSTASVSSGSSVLTRPRRFDILWPCTSTGIASFWNPNTRTQFAVLRPTPGSLISSSTVSGTIPS